jgi:hypothetical protein
MTGKIESVVSNLHRSELTMNSYSTLARIKFNIHSTAGLRRPLVNHYLVRHKTTQVESIAYYIIGTDDG